VEGLEFMLSLAQGAGLQLTPVLVDFRTPIIMRSSLIHHSLVWSEQAVEISFASKTVEMNRLGQYNCIHTNASFKTRVYHCWLNSNVSHCSMICSMFKFFYIHTMPGKFVFAIFIIQTCFPSTLVRSKPERTNVNPNK